MKVTEARLKAALDRPPADVRLFLLHGPDEAAAHAYAARLHKSLGADAERVDLEPGTLRGDPARLADEAAAISLFGGARFIRVTGAGEDVLAAVEALLAAQQAGNPAVVIAPGVKASGKLVKAALASDRAMAFACYLPEEKAASGIVQELAREEGLRLSPSAVQRIVRAADGDRAVMAREVEKLALYLDAAHDRPRDADEAAVAAIGAELNEGEIGAIVAAVIAGEQEALAAALRRRDGADASPIPILRALESRLIQMAEFRGGMDAGEGAEEVVERSRLFWKDKPAMVAALQRWNAGAIAGTLSRVVAAQRAAIAAGAGGGALGAQVLMQLAGDAFKAPKAPGAGIRSARR